MKLNDVLNERRFQIAFAIGVVYWLGLSLWAGHHSNFNTWFFIPGYFFLIIIAGALGWKFPAAKWQSGRDIGIGMTLTSLIISILMSGTFSVLPFTLFMMIALSLPLIAANWLGSYLRTHNVTGKNS